MVQRPYTRVQRAWDPEAELELSLSVMLPVSAILGESWNLSKLWFLFSETRHRHPFGRVCTIIKCNTVCKVPSRVLSA